MFVGFGLKVGVWVCYRTGILVDLLFGVNFLCLGVGFWVL